MCHIHASPSFGAEPDARHYAGAVASLVYGDANAKRKIAVLPDIYGLTPFYRAFAGYLSGRDAEVYLVNPWQPFGELPEATREAAYERRHKLRDSSYCDALARFLVDEAIDTIVGFCIGGNFVFELIRRGYQGTAVALYPLPWGMPNEDALDPAFDYLPDIQHEVLVLMGRADHLAGPENIETLESICATNPSLLLHLYEGSNHGFLADIDGDDAALKANARDSLDKLLSHVFHA